MLKKLTLNFDITVFMTFSVHTYQFPSDEIKITNNLLNPCSYKIKRVSRLDNIYIYVCRTTVNYLNFLPYFKIEFKVNLF